MMKERLTKEFKKEEEKIYLVGVYEEINDYGKICKKAYLYNIPGTLLEKNGTDVKYKFGECIHGGEIGFNCFFTLKEAMERVNGLNDYFEREGYLYRD